MRRPEHQSPALPPPDSPYWAERADAFLLVVEPEMRIRFVSENCEKIIGYSASELIGRMTLEFLQPEEVVDIVNIHQDFLKGGVTERLIRTYRKDRSPITFSIQVIPVREAGTVKELRMICHAVAPGNKVRA